MTIMLRPKGREIAVFVEVLTEDENEWGGYNLANPFGEFRTYSKDVWEVVRVSA